MRFNAMCVTGHKRCEHFDKPEQVFSEQGIEAASKTVTAPISSQLVS